MTSVRVSSSRNAHGTPCDPSVGAVISLEVEPTFLARVANTTCYDSNMEMCELAHCSRGPHALFHVKQLLGFDLVFRGSGE